MLTEKQIQDYIKIYEGYYGEKISKKEAVRQGTNLIELVKVITKFNTEVKNGIDCKYKNN